MLDNKCYLEFLYQTTPDRYANSRFEWGGTADINYQTVRFGSGEQYVMPIQTWIGVAPRARGESLLHCIIYLGRGVQGDSRWNCVKEFLLRSFSPELASIAPTTRTEEGSSFSSCWSILHCQRKSILIFLCELHSVAVGYFVAMPRIIGVTSIGVIRQRHTCQTKNSAVSTRVPARPSLNLGHEKCCSESSHICL